MTALPVPRRLAFRKVALALADTVISNEHGRALEPEAIVTQLEALLGGVPGAMGAVALFCGLFNLLSVPRCGRTFAGLTPPERTSFLNRLLDSPYFIPRMLGVGASLPFKLAYVSSPDAHTAAGVPYRKEKIQPEPEPRWMRQVKPAKDFDADETIEADVVVVGTGAGGAVAAKELAEKGLAVAIIEAGAFHRREDFTGNPLDMIPMLYHGKGVTATLGNAVIPIQIGRAVGGTTLINSATCFRTPEKILKQWVDMGLSDFTPEKMAPYFERVEGLLHVEECQAKYIGPIGEVIREGCEKLGYSCGPLKHNTIDCDGQGVCTQGCPKDAKQSTNISYIPRALAAAAQLFTGFEAQEILMEGERACGVRAVGLGRGGRRVRLTCRARAVILSGGALLTPTLIQKNALVRGNRWIGRNLTIHPCVFVIAEFPQRDMLNHATIPQGFMIDEFVREGLTFEGGTPPFIVFASILPGIGEAYTDLLASFNHLAIFGSMVKDTATGFVRPGPKGLPLIFYNLSRRDTDNLARSLSILGRVYFAAGARRVFLPTFNHPLVESPADLEKAVARNWKPRDMLLSAYHALGTARMGIGNRDSAIDTNHQCHQVPGLFVVDGSSIPTGLGVNPQETIMAVATRASEKIAELLG